MSSTPRRSIRCLVEPSNYDPCVSKLMQSTRGPAATYGTTVTRPSDFDAFWSAILDEAREIPLRPALRHIPLRSTPEVDVYEIGYDSLDGLRIAGWYCVPKESYVAAALPGAADRARLHLGADAAEVVGQDGLRGGRRGAARQAALEPPLQPGLPRPARSTTSSIATPMATAASTSTPPARSTSCCHARRSTIHASASMAAARAAR